MNYLPIDTFLGKLEILEVFEFYNIPLLFTCGNKNNDIYIVECLSEDANYCTWLYSHISDETALNLRRGIIDFRTAILSSVNDYFYLIDLYFDNKFEIKFLRKENINDDMLPFSGEKIDDPKKDIVPYFYDSLKEGKRLERGVFNIVLDVGDNCHVAPAIVIGDMISGVQRFFDYLARSKSGLYKPSEYIPTTIRNQTRLDVSNVFCGSFGVQFRTFQKVDGPALTLVDLVAKELSEIFSNQSDTNILIEKLVNLDRYTLRSLKSFLEPLLKLNAGMYFDYYSPKENKKISSSINLSGVKNTVDIVKDFEIEEEKVIVEGIFSGGMSRSNFFEIVNSSGKLYKGKMSKEAFTIVSTARLNTPCIATIFISKKQSKSSDRFIETYFLLDIKFINKKKDNKKIKND
jgi:hypothetical protein